MKEKIVLALAERDGGIISTAVVDTEKFSWGYPPNTLYWHIYEGRDKDQSPTGWGVDIFEPHLKFPGLFQTVEILDHWDGPTSRSEIEAIMTIATIRLSDGRITKEDLSDFVKRVLQATYPPKSEKGEKLMEKIYKIVVTGGPEGGKDGFITRLKMGQLRKSFLFVPEVATLLFRGGYPNPGRDLSWSPEWQTHFQRAIAAVQTSIERAYELQAREQEKTVLICNRGLGDGPAYTLGGLAAFCWNYGYDPPDLYERYDAIIHLESLAMSHPEIFGKIGNRFRYESPEQAQEIERRIQEAWSPHPRRFFVAARGDFKSKIKEAMNTLKHILANFQIAV